MKRIYKERRVYYFRCDICGFENRQTFHKKKIKEKICRRCKRNVVDPNQLTLFPAKKKIKFFSTFAGIGGFDLAMERQGFESVGFSEIDKYATEIYQKHFPHKNYGDITKIKAEELPDFDILVGGFPCQAFSIAGKRAGFKDTRGTLFFDLARILQAKKPRLFIFENVKGLLSHNNGRTFKTIISAVTELGYDCQWQVLNSKDFGVPQNRERVFIVGHLRGTARPKVFPITESNESNLEQIVGGGQGDRVYSTGGGQRYARKPSRRSGSEDGFIHAGPQGEWPQER